MSRPKTPAPYFDYRKKISNKSQLNQLQILCDKWSLSMSDVCWRLITDGLQNEKKKQEQIEELAKQNRKHYG